MPGSDPADHEQAHVPGVVGADLAAGLQPHVGDPPIGVVHAQAGVGDPHDLVNSPDLDWQSVWDRGWTLAAAAEDKPVESRTAEHGLPVRTPGARLVPGAANGTGLPGPDQPDSDREPQHAATARDPEAVRASFSSHFGGVRTGRSHAREQGDDQE
ncbi:hypothetical protein A5702_11435 [Mycobacterium sp. E3339]|nr:hypothetical protein A5702_11435 [Mycobacterium sp. E3339]